ncbi:hypothetical protein ABH973_000697 [Bradyrhizobium ottawaense]
MRRTTGHGAAAIRPESLKRLSVDAMLGRAALKDLLGKKW